MEPYQVTKDNMHMAIAVLLTNQSAIVKQLEDTVSTLKAVERQTTLTNGTVKRHTEEIATMKLDVAAVEAGLKESACPKTCVTLEAKVRELEDAKIVRDTQVQTVSWGANLAWTVVAGGGGAFVLWVIQVLTSK
jgi:septal ring factor EnvC (AmiA/AmiB activator)